MFSRARGSGVVDDFAGRVEIMSVPHVSVHPEDGQPCFEGTSTPIDVLFANLAAGERLDVILDHFPTITRAAAVAVLRESLRRVREEAMLDAGLSPDLRARAGAVMHPGDWDALQVDESREHYRANRDR
jgi:uncharacterized protein (DUF433 family)